MGRRHRSFFRLSAMDRRSPRDGRVIEELGWYDPCAAEDAKVNFKLDRVEYWLSVGAEPSETVASLLKKAGVSVAAKREPGHSAAGESVAVVSHAPERKAQAPAEAEAPQAAVAAPEAPQSDPADPGPAAGESSEPAGEQE
jgi:small subunit ribosomal protein S16